jgi:membrane-associated protease RseP (regulator of RpoE activity)
MKTLRPEINIMDSADQIRSIVERFFRIEVIRFGDIKDSYLIRYEGHLYNADSEQAYDGLSQALSSFGMMPLFRMEGQMQVILLVPKIENQKPFNPLINLLFFIITFISVLYVGITNSMTEAPAQLSVQVLWQLVLTGLPFTVSILSILLAHEFGHYFAGRIHKVHVSLPYFIPFPAGLGTFGAFINMRGIPKNRKQLLDIGIAGPLAGFVVAVPLLFIGLKLSTLNTLPLTASSEASMILEGNSLIYLALKYLAFGQLLPAPMEYGGIQPILYWVRYFFTSTPFPAGGMDVMLHPVAWAGWVGLMVTMLNLVPAGQFDGGHIFYVLFGKQGANKIYPWVLAAMIGLGFFWQGWWFWAAMVFVFGRMHAEPLDQITPLNPGRKRLAILGLLIFVICFIPVPLLAF